MREDFFNQLFMFFDTLIGGVIIGFIYDTINKILSFITKKFTLRDFAFWVVALIFLFKLCFLTSYFQVRIFLALAFVLGWFLYYLIISPIYKAILNFLLNIFKTIFNFVFTLVRKKKEKLYIKYNEPLTNAKLKLKRSLLLPIKEKISYNRYKSYFKKDKEEKRSGKPKSSPKARSKPDSRKKKKEKQYAKKEKSVN